MLTYKTRVMNWLVKLMCFPPIEEVAPPMPKIEKTVIIMRGWPGSGKSTLSKAILESLTNGCVGVDCHDICRVHIASADKWHVNPLTGKYEWKPENVSFAHHACRYKFSEAVSCGKTLLIVDNTNIRKKDYEYYVDVAQKHGYKVFQAIPNNPGMWDIDECFKRNVHNVPRETIQRMRDSFEDDPELERLILPSERHTDFQTASNLRREG